MHFKIRTLLVVVAYVLTALHTILCVIVVGLESPMKPSAAEFELLHDMPSPHPQIRSQSEPIPELSLSAMLSPVSATGLEDSDSLSPSVLVAARQPLRTKHTNDEPSSISMMSDGTFTYN